MTDRIVCMKCDGEGSAKIGRNGRAEGCLTCENKGFVTRDRAKYLLGQYWQGWARRNALDTWKLKEIAWLCQSFADVAWRHGWIQDNDGYYYYDEVAEDNAREAAQRQMIAAACAPPVVETEYVLSAQGFSAFAAKHGIKIQSDNPTSRVLQSAIAASDTALIFDGYRIRAIPKGQLP